MFDPRPALRINTFISGMAARFRNARSLSGQAFPGSEGHLCDVCANPKEGTEECKEKGKTRACVEHLIQERLLKIEQLKQSVKLSKREAGTTTTAIAEDCSTLIISVQKGLEHFKDVIEQKQKATEKQAEGFIKQLEEEISELMAERSEMMQLSQTNEHSDLLQNAQPMKITTKDWTRVTVQSSCDMTVRTAAAKLERISTEMKELSSRVELEKVRLYGVDVTLDPNTANPYLVLSDDGKRVSCGDAEQVLPDKPERLSSFGVLGRQSFSSGRFYYEVKVKGKTKWDLGVVRESVNRKGENTICPENGYWVVWLRNGLYRALTSPSEPLSLMSKPHKVGVFVDYEEGLVSFYDAEAAHLLFSFTRCDFREKLHPYFSPCPSDGGRNSAPLIISSISQTD